MRYLLILSAIWTLLARAALAGDSVWTFDGNDPLPGWKGSSWFADDSNLTNIYRDPTDGRRSNLYGNIQTPPIIIDSSGSGATSGLATESGTGQGGLFSITILISNFTCNPQGDEANCVVELLRVDQNSNLIATISTGLKTNERIEQTYDDSYIEADGVYSVRFRAYDNDNPDTFVLAADLTITNSRLQDIFDSADFNRNYVVDSADYTIWRDNLYDSANVGAPGNANGDTIINEVDYGIWRSRFGKVAGEASLTVGVPEASCIHMSLIGLLALINFRGRERR